MYKSLFNYCILLFLCFGCEYCTAQGIYTFKGKLISTKSGEAIPFGNIFDSLHQTQTTTDSNGFFDLKLAAGNYSFEFSSVGYEPIIKNILLNKDLQATIILSSDTRLDEIIVTTEKFNKTVEMNASGMNTLTSASVERLPSFAGEKDILKAVLLTPGIQSGQEGARGVFVRGGSPDQNLLLFHNAPVYNVAHIYGFLSVFTAEALSKMDIHKNYIPVQFGGRLSSVINIEPNFGNTEQWRGDFSAGAITTKFHIEGPIKKDKTSFNFSIRECHVGLFTGPISQMQYNKAGEDGSLKYFFYDINAAIRHKINDRNTISWSMYTGNDFYSFDESSIYEKNNLYSKDKTSKKLNWMNLTNSLEWVIKLPKLTISNNYTYSFYKLNSKQQLLSIYRNYSKLTNSINTIYYNNLSKISDNGWQTNFEQKITSNHLLNYGIKTSGRGFTINEVDIAFKDSTGSLYLQDKFTNPKVHSFDGYLYLDYLFSWRNKIDIKSGIQLLTYYGKDKVFFYPQPRVEIIYHPITGMSMRTSIQRTVQTMHLLTNNTGDVQNDVWVPATSKVEPETGWQYSGGIQFDHPKGYTASIDGYYKTMQHLSDYKYNTRFTLDRIAWDEQLLNSGVGKAYGVEFFAAKTKGQFTAWMKYNLSWSIRQFPELNEGKPFYYKYDRRHDVAIVLQYKMKKHFDFTLAWTYGTGWRMTTANAKFASDNTLSNYDNADAPLTGNQNLSTYWDKKNNYILPAYHHLDIGMNYVKTSKRVTHQLNISIYNVYNNFNVFSVFRKDQRDAEGNQYKKYVQLSLFPILPSIGYTLKFEKKP